MGNFFRNNHRQLINALNNSGLFNRPFYLSCFSDIQGIKVYEGEVPYSPFSECCVGITLSYGCDVMNGGNAVLYIGQSLHIAERLDFKEIERSAVGVRIYKEEYLFDIDSFNKDRESLIKGGCDFFEDRSFIYIPLSVIEYGNESYSYAFISNIVNVLKGWSKYFR